MASRYESSPNPMIDPFAAAAIIDVCRYSSLACILEMCTSITGAGTARMASPIAIDVCVYAPALRTMPSQENRLLEFSDEFALYVGLIVCNVVLGITLLQFTEIIFETFFSVNAFFSLPQKVKIRPVNNKNIHKSLSL